ncbi:DUF983 domain-containing protein [Prosthecomicrobium sp. N25]|uniref:DUF983 domain-containing protein n=1 Tax=Prosthecomicrobium sp. N25 TaxID=3129254 RepID=UPI0030783A50
MAGPPLDSVSPVAAGIACRCPRCGRGKLYAGYLDVAPACTECGLDYRFIDSGDGPAVFVILIVGFVVVAAALVTEVKYHPPIWLHMAIWLPLILVLSLGLLRPLKATLIALQYANRAREGRLED